MRTDTQDFFTRLGVIVIVIFIIIFFMVLNIKALDNSSLVECSKNGLTYFSYNGIHYCGNVEDLSKLFSELIDKNIDKTHLNSYAIWGED